ncbi:TY5A [Symbiodinium sp. CCMP2592]|nr:TY5A [Symbiodinium sp. CCMP2592]
MTPCEWDLIWMKGDLGIRVVLDGWMNLIILGRLDLTGGGVRVASIAGNPGSPTTRSAPRVARIEQSAEQVEMSAEQKLSSAEEAMKPSGKDDVNFDGMAGTVRSGLSTSSPEKDHSVGSRDRPLPEDPRELIPGSDAQPSRVEELLLQAISENRMLRQRLDQVEVQSNWRNMAPSGQDGPVGSPASLTPPPGFGGRLASASVQTGGFRAIQQFAIGDLQGAQVKGVSEDTASADQGSAGVSVGSAASASLKDELVAEATRLLKGVSLKAIRIGDPTSLKECGINQAWLQSVIQSASDQQWALIDSGATNGLRPVVDDTELGDARAITVDLASGVTQLHINTYGTLLTEGPSQVIIPAGYLIELGYKVTWGKKGCKVRHPKDGLPEKYLSEFSVPVVSEENFEGHLEVRARRIFLSKLTAEESFRGKGFDPIASGRDKGDGYRYFLACAYSFVVPICSPSGKSEGGVPADALEYEPSVVPEDVQVGATEDLFPEWELSDEGAREDSVAVAVGNKAEVAIQHIKIVVRKLLLASGIDKCVVEKYAAELHRLGFPIQVAVSLVEASDFGFDCPEEDILWELDLPVELNDGLLALLKLAESYRCGQGRLDEEGWRWEALNGQLDLRCWRYWGEQFQSGCAYAECPDWGEQFQSGWAYAECPDWGEQWL